MTAFSSIISGLKTLGSTLLDMREEHVERMVALYEAHHFTQEELDKRGILLALFTPVNEDGSVCRNNTVCPFHGQYARFTSPSVSVRISRSSSTRRGSTEGSRGSRSSTRGKTEKLGDES